MTVRLGRQGELFWRNRCVCDRVLSLKSVARIQTNSNFCATGHNDKPLSLRQIFSREFSKLHWENYRCDKAGRNFPVIGGLMRFGLKFSLISRKYLRGTRYLRQLSALSCLLRQRNSIELYSQSLSTRYRFNSQIKF